MTKSQPFKLPTIFCVLAMAFALILEPATASAQEMKRGGGSMSRSAGSTDRGSSDRRGNSLGSSRRGAGESMKSERSKMKTEKKEHKKKKNKSDDDDDDDSSSSSWGSSRDDDDEEPDFGGRTLGSACMYGVNDEVIFRPEGSICRGDEPPPLEEYAEYDEGEMSEDESALSAAAPAAAFNAAPEVEFSAAASAPQPAAQPISRRRSRRAWPGEGKPKACIFSMDGSVLHAPGGVNCD